MEDSQSYMSYHTEELKKWDSRSRLADLETAVIWECDSAGPSRAEEARPFELALLLGMPNSSAQYVQAFSGPLEKLLGTRPIPKAVIHKY